MTSKELERYLHEHIPLSAAMQVEVVEINWYGVVLNAPLGPNINHRETVFGGSASALAILAAWSLLHYRLRTDGMTVRLVIQQNSMTYDRPIFGIFSARSSLIEEEDWPRFMHMLARKGKARTNVRSLLLERGKMVGRFHGKFVAIAADESNPIRE